MAIIFSSPSWAMIHTIIVEAKNINEKEEDTKIQKSQNLSLFKVNSS